MATPTYTAIASITLGSSASSVTFSSIPQDYRDLIVVGNWQLSGSSSFRMRLNNDAGSNYSNQGAGGIGTTTQGFSNTAVSRINISSNATQTFKHLNITQIFDYTATDKHKTTLNRLSGETNNVWMIAGRYASTSAITSIELFPDANTINTGSTFALYGIAS